MDLSQSAAYHGDSYDHRESHAGGDYRGQLNTAFLTTLSADPAGQPDDYQFLEAPDVEAFNQEIRAYADLLEEHGTETVLAESERPNAAYTADAYLGFEGDLYCSRMASEVRRPEEPERFAFAHGLGYDPVVPFQSGEYFEISSAIPSPEGLVIGVGQRSTESAARRLAACVDCETTIVRLSDYVQHTMGALRPLPDGRAAIRPDHVEEPERLESQYEGFVEFDETDEVLERQAMNFTVAADDTIIMPDDTPNAEAKLVEKYNVATTSIEDVRAGAGGLACLTGRVD